MKATSRDTATVICGELKKPRYKYLSRAIVGDLWWEDVLQDVALHTWQIGIRDVRTLPAWMKITVRNRAVNMRRAHAKFQYSLDDFVNEQTTVRLADNLPFDGVSAIESTLFISKYWADLNYVAQLMLAELADIDRFILYERIILGRQLGEIARLLGIHQSNVTRRLVRIVDRINSRARVLLESRQLSKDEVDECVLEMFNNRHYLATNLAEMLEN